MITFDTNKISYIDIVDNILYQIHIDDFGDLVISIFNLSSNDYIEIYNMELTTEEQNICFDDNLCKDFMKNKLLEYIKDYYNKKIHRIKKDFMEETKDE